MCNPGIPRVVVMIPLVALSAVLEMGRTSPAEAAETWGSTVNSVRGSVLQNELLYENLEVVLDCRYEIGDPKLHSSGGGFFNIDEDVPEADLRSGAASKPGASIRPVSQIMSGYVSQRSETIHFVSQDGMLRLDWQGTSTSSNKKVRSWHRAVLFDGTATRLYDEAPIDRLYPVSAILREAVVRPHMLLLSSLDLGVPLSAYLEGEQAKEVSYEGVEEWRDLKCHKLRITNLRGRELTPSVRWDLWLAEARNFIPVRMREYKLGGSSDLPHAEATVDDWQEIQPGVWFPISTTIVKYNRRSLLREKKQKLQWRETCVVIHVSLDPNHEKAYFQEFGGSK